MSLFMYKNYLAAGCLGFFAVCSHAVLQSNLETGGPGIFTGTFENTEVAPGPFTNTFDFQDLFGGPDIIGPSLLNAQINSVFARPSSTSQEIIFTSVKITAGSQTFVFDPSSDIVINDTITRFALLFDSPFTSSDPFIVEVQGCAGSCNATSGPSASYSGSFNIRPDNHIPEPATLALAIAALSGAGFASSRRRRGAPA